MAATLKAGAGLLREAMITGCRCDQTQSPLNRCRPHLYAFTFNRVRNLTAFFRLVKPCHFNFSFSAKSIVRHRQSPARDSFGFQPLAPSTTGRELYPRTHGKQGVCEDFFGVARSRLFFVL